MGGLREWANQAAGQPNETYEPSVYFPWAAIVSNIAPGHIVTSAEEDGSTGADADGVAIGAYKPATFTSYEDFFGLDADGSFNIATELYFLRTENGGNPYGAAKAYSPDRDIQNVQSALSKLSREISQRVTGRSIEVAASVALRQAEAILGDDLIDAMIEAERQRAYTDYLASKSAMLGDMWIAGGLIVTNTMGDLAALEDGFNRTINAFATKARVAREDQRAQLAGRIMEVYLNQDDQNVRLYQVYLSAALDVLKFSATVKQDEIDKNIEYRNASSFWNVGLLQLALNANSAIFGAQMQTRGQTKGERFAASLMGSASMGIQGGLAMGSPAAGLAIGGLNFLSQTLLQ